MQIPVWAAARQRADQDGGEQDPPEGDPDLVVDERVAVSQARPRAYGLM